MSDGLSSVIIQASTTSSSSSSRVPDVYIVEAAAGL